MSILAFPSLLFFILKSILVDLFLFISGPQRKKSLAQIYLWNNVFITYKLQVKTTNNYPLYQHYYFFYFILN